MGPCIGLQRWMATTMTMKAGKQPDLWTVLTIRSRLYSRDALPFTEFFEDSLEHLGDSERIAWWKLYEELISQLLEELQNEPEAEQVGNFCIEDRSPRNLDTCESIRQSWKIRNCGTAYFQSRSLQKTVTICHHPLGNPQNRTAERRHHYGRTAGIHSFEQISLV